MSTRITKSIAEDVATSLLAELQKKIDDTYKEMQDYTLKVLGLRTPMVIKECVNDTAARQYIKKCDSLHISCFSDLFYLKLDKTVPDNGNRSLVLSESEAKDFHLMKLKYEKLKLKYKNLFDEIVNTLVKLSTYNNVVNNFPEAVEFLPEKRNTSLMINIDNTRNKLKQAIE